MDTFIRFLVFQLDAHIPLKYYDCASVLSLIIEKLLEVIALYSLRLRAIDNFCFKCIV